MIYIKQLILSAVFLVVSVASDTNLVINGDFESGAKEPWICNGCAGYVVHPGHDSDSSYTVENRQAAWSGPKQWLNVSNLAADGRYNFGYSINTDAPVLLRWKLKATLAPEDVRYYVIDTFDVQVAGEWQEMESKIINFPPPVLDATEVQLYLEGDPGTSFFRMDDVYLTTREDPDNWEEEANERIEKLRKSNADIKIVASSNHNKGQASGYTLQVEQKTHNFAFGTALDCGHVSECLQSEVDDEYCQFASDHYNMLVCAYRMKIRYVEEVQGEYNYQSGDDMIEWTKLHNMRARGHALLWAKESNNPDWLKPMYGDEFIAAVYDRVDDATKRYSGYVEHWDVINEMVDQGGESHRFYIEHSGDENIRPKIFQRAKEISPETMFFLNDYGIVDDRYGRFNLFQEQIRELLAGGAPIDGIGLQSHFTGYELDPYQIKDNVDKLSNEFGIPMWVTEFTWSRGDIDDPNHELHAKQLENYYRLMFSLESINGFLMWHFSNGKDSNIVDTDTFTTNLAGEKYISLYHEEWRTNATLEDQGTENENEIATFSFRGFKGDYNIKLMDGDNELKSWTLNLDEDSEWVLEY